MTNGQKTINGQKIILVAEDELLLRNALRDKLVREGFKVFEAKNGKEALKVALREHPDLILLDIIMPVMDGMTMLAKLREDAWGKDARVIVLTNLSEIAVAHESYDYLVKSDWKIEDLIARVRSKLGNNHNK